MKKEIIEIAAKTMKITPEEAEKHYKELPEEGAFYFWNPVRGGICVIIAPDGSKLAATSAVNFERHLEEYKKGRRN